MHELCKSCIQAPTMREIRYSTSDSMAQMKSSGFILPGQCASTR